MKSQTEIIKKLTSALLINATEISTYDGTGIEPNYTTGIAKYNSMATKKEWLIAEYTQTEINKAAEWKPGYAMLEGFVRVFRTPEGVIIVENGIGLGSQTYSTAYRVRENDTINYKSTKNLTHEVSGNDRIYILWDNLQNEDGEIIDCRDEVDNYSNGVLSDSNFQQMEHDESVASYYGYDNCLICGIDIEE